MKSEEKKTILRSRFSVNPLDSVGIHCITSSSGGNADTEENNINETNSTNTGFDNISGEVVNSTVNASGGSEVIMTDYGSVRDAIGLVGQAMNSASAVNAASLKAVKDQSTSFAEKLSGFAEQTHSNNDERITETMNWTIGAVAAVAAVMAWRRRSA